MKTKGPTTIRKRYVQKGAYLTARGVLQNPENLRQIPLSFDCRVDTGFDGGILIPHWHISDAKLIGVEPSVTNITMADGRKISAYVCVAFLQEIEGHGLPHPGLPVMLVMCGNRRGSLLGMDALKNHVISFDGPAQSLELAF